MGPAMNTVSAAARCGGGQGESTGGAVVQACTTIKAIAKYEGAISWDITKPIGTPKKGLDITKIKNTGWHASVTLEQGLSQTIEYFRKNVLQNWHNVS